MAQTIGADLGRLGANLNGVKNGHGMSSSGASGTSSSRASSSNGRTVAARSSKTKHVQTPSKKAAAQETNRKAGKQLRGLPVERRFTTKGIDPLDEVTWERRSSIINNTDGSTVFKMEGAEIPSGWSQLATDIVVSKYFRKAGIEGDAKKGETSVRDVVTRLAKTIREAGDRFGGYFASTKDADAFEAELSYLLVNQYGAFNSPVWFNCGLYHRYGITGTGGNFAVSMDSLAQKVCETSPGVAPVSETPNAYERPQCSACFIQAVGDDLMSIYDLVKSEARLFKYGSGTGTNFSAIRGKQEKLSGGGTSSGLMSFLEVLDRAAGATKSGGTTRRAAKMAVSYTHLTLPTNREV